MHTECEKTSLCKGFAWFNDPTPDDGDNNCYLKNIPAVILLDVAKQCPYHPVVDFYVKDGLIKDPPAPPPPPFPPPSPSPLPPQPPPSPPPPSPPGVAGRRLQQSDVFDGWAFFELKHCDTRENRYGTPYTTLQTARDACLADPASPASTTLGATGCLTTGAAAPRRGLGCAAACRSRRSPPQPRRASTATRASSQRATRLSRVAAARPPDGRPSPLMAWTRSAPSRL